MSDFDIDAKLDALFGPMPKPPRPKPKLVVDDDVVVRDVNMDVGVDAFNRPRRVVVPAADPDFLTRPTRNDRVIINMQEAERQFWERQQSEAVDRRQRRDADPFSMGHWGRNDD